jgi:two-component system OmpR family response regulator
MHILIIDSNAASAERYALKLRRAGARTTYHADGITGLAAIRMREADAVLLDPVLSGLDGFEILRELKRTGEPHAPIILHTALDGRDEIMRALRLGAHDYLIKSRFTPDDVVSKLMRMRHPS